MSVQDYQNAIKLIHQNPDDADFEGPKAESLIREAEAFLGVTFPETYKMFLRDLGCGDIAGMEIYGIISSDFVNSSVPDAIWLTSEERLSGLPETLIIISATGDGSYYALDTGLQKESACPVVLVNPGQLKRQPYPVIANDFGTFLLDKVEIALS